MLDVLLLIASLALLTLGADLLVRGSVATARRLGVSSFFIGLTIVGFGTSTPELAASLAAALRGRGAMAVGNVMGSNIFNIAVILGITAIIKPITVHLRIVRSEVVFVLGVAFVPLAAMVSDGWIGRPAGAIMVAGLVAYLWRGYRIGRREAAAEREDEARSEAELEHELGTDRPAWRDHPLTAAASIALGLGLLVGGSDVLVDAATSIARSLGVSHLVIGLTVVAAGTSAPELFTSLVATWRGQSEIAVGNVLGSNIFNILGVLGVTCLARPEFVERQTMLLDAPVMIAASAALLPIVTSEARISRTEGLLLVLCYVAYVVVLYRWAPVWF